MVVSIIISVIGLIGLIFSVKNLIIYEKPKYEFKLYEGNAYMVSQNLPRLQSEGWELAGQITTQYSNGSSSNDRMLIPLKRKLK